MKKLYSVIFIVIGVLMFLALNAFGILKYVDNIKSGEIIITQKPTPNPTPYIVYSNMTNINEIEYDYEKILLTESEIILPKDFNSGSKANIITALRFINNGVLEHDQIFSFDAVVGRRIEQRGFVIGKNTFNRPSIGGGMSVAASVIYKAIKSIDLKIIEREISNDYDLTMQFMKRSETAMVGAYWGYQDFRFEYDTGIHSLLFECGVSGDSVYCRIYRLVAAMVVYSD